MPYYFGEGDSGWDEYQNAQEAEYLAKQDKRAPPVPSARALAKFLYMEPWEAKTSVLSFARHPRPVTPAADASPASPPAPQAAPNAQTKRGLLARLFGAKAAAPAAPPAPRPERKVEIGSEEWLANYHIEQKRRSEEALERVAVTAAALRENGVRKLLLRYDGGNDEGFTHFEALEMADGRRLTKGDAEAVKAIGAAVKAIDGDSGDTADFETYGYLEMLDDAAIAFLGPGFGTGPFEMYGAITIDCEACTMTDEADPARARPAGDEDEA